jgi:peptidoglycan/LPS O-acetylase OafA/YrhL
MPELDTIRGVAILAVVLLHGFSWQYGGYKFGPVARAFLTATQPGWLGVNLFFVLSGFLITGILLDSKTSLHYYRRFYTRRALRILPAYYSLLLLLLLLRNSSLAFAGLSFVFLANMTDFFGVLCSYGPLWSLAVEEHFYIIWPTVIRKLSQAQIAAVALGIIVLVPTARALAFLVGWRDGLNWYTWFVVDGLAIGSLLAVTLRTAITRKQVTRLCAALLSLAVAVGFTGLPFGIATRNRLLGAALQCSTANIFFAGILLLFLLAGTGRGKRYVCSPTLRFFGYISYGLYLNHMLAYRLYDTACLHYWPGLTPSNGHFELVLLKFVVATGAAIGGAYLSRKYFEERFLQLKQRSRGAATELPNLSLIQPDVQIAS